MSTAKLADVVIPLAELAESWLLGLEAEHKSPATLRAYRDGVTGFLAWHAAQGSAGPVLDRPAVAAYLADLRRAGRTPATCRLRYAALRRFSRWLADEGETETDALAGLRPPQRDKPVVPRLSDEELAALLGACKGQGFTDRRGEAIVRLMTEGLLRSAELLALTTADVDVRRGLALVRRGKGGKGRYVAFGPETGRALDRYLRMRRRHPLAHTPELWLPAPGWPAFTYPGLARALRLRAQAAGIEGFHVHRLRHTGASRWLAAGGSEGGLMAAGGWTDRTMIDRYTGDTAADRAIAEARRLGLDHLG
jgi:site-specific recombinase XerD